MNMQRRSFLTYFGVGWAVSCFPLVLAACDQGTKKSVSDPKVAENLSPTETKANTEIAAAGGFTVVGTVADLDKVGMVGNKQVAVVRNPTNKSQVLAVNPTCTHKGCTVNWKAAEKKYECPCHDSYFGADGKVKQGPATMSLTSYPAKIEGGKVLAKTS